MIAGDSLVLLRETREGAAILVLGVRVIELFLLARHGIILAHVHRLLDVSHFAVTLLISGELVGVNH